MTETPHPLGRLVEHDPRSRAFAYVPPAALPTHSTTWPRRVPIFNQNLQGPDGTPLGSCTGNAGVGWEGTDPHADRHVSEADVVPLYSAATVADGFPGEYPPEDSGSSGLAIAKVLKRTGRISGYSHAFSFGDALAAVAVTPVIVGVNWYDSMFDPDAHGYVDISPDSSIAGGHEFLIRGVDPRKQHVLCDNSWGLDWGRNGRFWLRFATLKRLLGEQGDATILHR